MSFQTTQTTETILVELLQRLAHEYSQCCISCPMVMLALMEGAEQMVTFAFQEHNISLADVRQALVARMENCPPRGGELEYSPEVLDVVEQAQSYAEETAGGIIAPEHILWGLLVCNNEVSALLRERGMAKSSLASTIRRYRHEPEETETRPQGNQDLPTISQYSRDLIAAARAGEIEATIGRDDEMRLVLRALCRKNKNNPVLVGPPGTGKTAIVEGLALRIARGEVPAPLRQLRLFSLQFSAMTAECCQQGELDKILRKVIEEATAQDDVVLFIDEIHTLISKGCGMNAADTLKPEMARGALRIIGATTEEEYRQHIEKDKAFERRFQKILINEPDEEAAIAILRGVKKRYEEHFHIKISDSAVVAAVQLSMRYLPDRYLPDKALDLLDEAGAVMQMERESVPEELDQASSALRHKEIELESIRSDYERQPIPPQKQQEINELQMEIANLRERENLIRSRWRNECRMLEQLQEMESERERLLHSISDAEAQRQYRQVVTLRQQEEELSRRIACCVEDQTAQRDTPLLKRAMDEEEIRDVVSVKTGIPVSRMTADEQKKLSGLRAFLEERIIGQSEAAQAVSRIIRRSRMGLSDASKPIGSFLFLGTTGVGKTALAKVLAEFLFNSPDMMVRIDMSEYQQEHSAMRLFGAPPSYVGHEAGGQLTEAVHRKPYSVVLFDEIEKAHPKVFQTLLQVLDDGRMTDGQGRTVNFRNTVIIMTSNMGHDIITRHLEDGRMTPETMERVKNLVLSQLRERVAPEFLNRINEIVMFQPLSKETIRSIVLQQLRELCQDLTQKHIDLRYDKTAVNFLTEVSYEPEFGARPVARALDLHVTDALIDKLEAQELVTDKPICLSSSGPELVLCNLPE